MRKITEKDVNRIKSMIDGSDICLLATSKGVVLAGRDIDIANLFSNIVMRMKESGFDLDLLKLAFEEGLKEESKKKSKEKDDELKGILKDFLESIRDDLDKMLGDDK